jgi:predicted O-methyltransferase YrrM
VKTLDLSPSLCDYLLSISLREPDILAKIRLETASHPHAAMQISPDQGQFFDLMVRLLQPRKVIEVGVFTGYSSTCIALAMPPGGRLVACELSQQYAQIAHAYWMEAGVAGKVDLRLGPAAETLRELLARGEEKSFDLAFLDADKTSMTTYYELCLQLMRPGGLIVVDNVLWSGRVADPAASDPDTVALREFNARVHQDSRVDLAVLAIADGLTLARVR